MVRAKFRCDSVTLLVNGAQITLIPVTSGSEENESFYKWTPAGSISLSLVSKATANHFYPGHEYYIDFTEVTSVDDGQPKS